MNTINPELDILSDWFKANRLSLNIKKTNYILFEYLNKLALDNTTSASYIKMKINDYITEVNQTKFLGVMINPEITWPHHITYISAKFSKLLYFLCRLRNKLNSSLLF